MKNNITLFTSALALSVCCTLPLTSLAQDGSLDLSFDSDGKVTTGIQFWYDAGNSVAIQSDGKIVVAGSSYNGSNDDFALVRYNADGSLDTSFDTDGKVITAIGSDFDQGFSVAIQSDGKIVAAGYTYNDPVFEFALIRYNADGSLDNTFDTDGKVTTPIGSVDDQGISVAIQSDGKIVVAGYSDDGLWEDFAVVRYNSAGVGISEFSNNVGQISIYPNPFYSTTTLQTENILNNATFTV